MADKDRKASELSPYEKIYEENFYERADGMGHWSAGTLKVGDTLAAFAYAMGVGSFEELRGMIGFTSEREVTDIPARKLVSMVLGSNRRWPNSVLDIGGGRGELACCFAMMGAPVQLIEPHPKAAWWLAQTSEKLFGWAGPPKMVRLINKPVQDAIGDVELADIDTVTMSESIEHIPAEWFDPFWAQVKPILQYNKGRLIVVNWPSFHPIEVSGDEHCREINDAVYDSLADGGRTVYRQGSHLVVDF